MRSLPCLLSLALGCQAYLAFPPSVYVCPTYPFCALDLKTRAWSSSLTDSQGAPTGIFESLEMDEPSRGTPRQQGNLSREGKVEDSHCWLEESYCAPDYSKPPLTGTDVDSAAKCRAACKKDDECNYFTFHNYHGQAKCYKLSSCSLTVAQHCPTSNICASGSKECGCPALEPNPTDSTSTTAYATWRCDSGVKPYSQVIPAGTACQTDCKGWTGQVSVSLASTCQPMGDWTDTEAGYAKPAGRTGRSFNLFQPDSGPIKCACKDLGPYNYNPNTRPGEAGVTKFVCDNWSPEKYTAPFTISSSDRCDLFCDKALVKTFQCEGNTWSGEPEKGFWCMSPPEQEGAAAASQGGEEEQDGWKKVFSHDTRGGLFDGSKADVMSKNPTSPSSLLYSVLDTLEDFRRPDDSFLLRICFPELQTGTALPCNEWSQTSNPATDAFITGFRPVVLQFSQNSYEEDWGGLGVSPGQAAAYIDDTPKRSRWWFAVGASSYHKGEGNIPGPLKIVKKVEMYAFTE